MYSGLSATHYVKTFCNILIFYREHLGINELGKEVESYCPLLSKSIFAKQNAQHLSMIFQCFLEMMISSICLSTRVFSHTGIDPLFHPTVLMLISSQGLFLLSANNSLPRFLHYLSTFSSYQSLANSSIVVLIMLLSLYYVTFFHVSIRSLVQNLFDC